MYACAVAKLRKLLNQTEIKTIEKKNIYYLFAMILSLEENNYRI